MYYLNVFFIMSITGHFIENFFYKAKDSGILYGYWTPIYGIGAIIITTINTLVAKKKLRSFYHVLIVFFISALTLSIMEYIGGYLIELIFNKVFWDYSDKSFHIGKYTSLTMSLIWGISSIIFLYIIKPFLDILIKRIPNSITYILSILFLTDTIFTFLKAFN